MKKHLLNLIISALLLTTTSLYSQELIVKSNLENLTMRVGETFKPTSFAEDLQGEQTMCQAVIYYNKKGVFSTAKAVTVDRDKGTIRANHYHPQQEQKCLFTKGQIIEIFQDVVNPNSPKITQVVNEGQLSVIKPNVAHAMVFTKDTTFLNLVRGEREHKNYGITHTIKHVFVDEKEKNFPIVTKVEKCIIEIRSLHLPPSQIYE